MRNHHAYDTVISLVIGGVILAEDVGVSLILARRHGDLELQSVCVKDSFTDAYEEIAKGCTKPIEQAIWAMAEYLLEADYGHIEDAIAEAMQMEAA